jgi:hypothetical protein
MPSWQGWSRPSSMTIGHQSRSRSGCGGSIPPTPPCGSRTNLSTVMCIRHHGRPSTPACFTVCVVIARYASIGSKIDALFAADILMSAIRRARRLGSRLLAQAAGQSRLGGAARSSSPCVEGLPGSDRTPAKRRDGILRMELVRVSRYLRYVCGCAGSARGGGAGPGARNGVSGRRLP